MERMGSAQRMWVALVAVSAMLMAAAIGVDTAGAGDPQVNFQVDQPRGGVPLTVTFRNTSNDGDGDIVGFFWEFGDGQTSADENPTHTYHVPGEYDVRLTVTDRQGNVGAKTDTGAVTVDPPGLVAAALPVSRSVQVGSPATAFVSVINVGAITATGVGIEIHPSTAPGGVPGAPLPGTFGFQATDPATNLVTGTPNGAVDILPGQTASFVVALAPDAPLSPTDVRFEIKGTNTSTARIVPGLNTLLLSASATPGPDIIAIASIADGTPAVQVPGATGMAAFALATANVGGAGGSITVSADTGGTPLPLGLAICQTEPATGTCVTAPAPTITVSIDVGATPTFSVFVTGSGVVRFDPEVNRIFVRFTDALAVVRGATSAAVKTQ